MDSSRKTVSESVSSLRTKFFPHKFEIGHRATVENEPFMSNQFLIPKRYFFPENPFLLFFYEMVMFLVEHVQMNIFAIQ